MQTCRSCKKKFRSQTHGCPTCRSGREASSLPTRGRKKTKPGRGRTPKKKIPLKASRAKLTEQYVDLFEGDSREAVELGVILKKDSIPFRVEERDTLKFRFRLHETRHLGMGDGRAVKVPASFLGKARALLKWEQGKKREVSGEDYPPASFEGAVSCPSCAADVDFEDILCPECGLDLNLEALESDEEEYYCFSCGESCSPEVPVCPVCGANFDH